MKKTLIILSVIALLACNQTAKKKPPQETATVEIVDAVVIAEPSNEAIDIFYDALDNNDTACVLEFIKKGNFSANYEPAHKVTPLTMAIWENNLDMVKILVSNGANINSENGSAINACLGRSSAVLDVTEEDMQKTLEILKYLLSQGGNPNTPNAFDMAGNSFYDAAKLLLKIIK